MRLSPLKSQVAMLSKHSALPFLLFASAACEAPAAEAPCSQRVALFPVDRNQSQENVSVRRRFEVRQCLGGSIQILQFEQNADKPTYVVSIGEPWPPFVAHVMNTLVLQNVGGVSSRVFVFNFTNGKPVRPIQRGTTGYVDVSMSDDGTTVVIKVPAEQTMNGVLSAGKEYRFPIE
jgi:hypothetical protein